MTRGVLLAWAGAAVAVLAILAALLWPMEATVAPLPTAEASVASPSAVPELPPVVAAPVEQAATTDARGRVVRKPPSTKPVVAPSAVPAQAASPKAAAPPPAPARAVPVEDPTTSTTPPGDGGGILNPGGGGAGQPGG